MFIETGYRNNFVIYLGTSRIHQCKIKHYKKGLNLKRRNIKKVQQLISLVSVYFSSDGVLYNAVV